MTNHGTGRVRLEYRIPARGLIGYRSSSSPTRAAAGSSTTSSTAGRRGTGDPRRTTGALVADREGRATGYAIDHLQPRGTFFVRPGDAGLRGAGRRRARPGERPRRERDEGEEADEHAGVHLRRGDPPVAGAPHEPRSSVWSGSATTNCWRSPQLAAPERKRCLDAGASRPAQIPRRLAGLVLLSLLAATRTGAQADPEERKYLEVGTEIAGRRQLPAHELGVRVLPLEPTELPVDRPSTCGWWSRRRNLITELVRTTGPSGATPSASA